MSGITLRNLEARDIFIMSKILGSIGIKELKNCFKDEEIKKLINNKEADEDKNDMDGVTITDEQLKQVGISVALEMAGMILNNLMSCEKYIYKLISNLSGLEEDTVKTLPIDVFAEIIVDICKKEEFKDFIRVASSLFK